MDVISLCDRKKVDCFCNACGGHCLGVAQGLSVFEPCGDEDNRSIWLEVPIGKITDWMTYEEAQEYEDVTTKEEYEMAWKDYDGYVGTYHYLEFAKTGYRPYLNGSNIQQVYKTWSEAVTAGLLELIERRKNDI